MAYEVNIETSKGLWSIMPDGASCKTDSGEKVNFGAQSAARSPDGLVVAGFFRDRAVLMRAHDGAVDHRVFIVSVGRQKGKDPFPDTYRPSWMTSTIMSPA
jgi:hypothetical protein